MPKTQCPNCQREDQVSALMAKMPVLCKTCGTRVVVQAEQRSTSGIVPTPAVQKAVVPMAPPPILPPPPPMLPPPPVVTKS